ncbi:DUF6036 family nucleotidyltransferase [Ferviditalea candida]|uniref:DUF6036 family nucleotidyltransferase n=1 Tax=Ferviditalea candida TaxID=3108399 RepID=A0ABU5ZM33_9BACL|nr:DUF6036 family nucleotidyltransferase [Paenibacillaceae bacterium T2]
MNIDKARQKIIQLQNQSKFEKMMGVCSILTSLTEKEGLKPIIVGGFAVEIYSRSEYTTVDIDLIFSRRDIIDQYLQKLGFIKSGRHWFHEELGVSVEVPNDMLDLADPDKLIKLNLQDQSFVYVIGLEDIILDRLRACVHWTSLSDCEWGYRLFLLHDEKLDMNYMQQKAVEDRTEEKLKLWTEKRSGNR